MFFVEFVVASRLSGTSVTKLGTVFPVSSLWSPDSGLQPLVSSLWSSASGLSGLWSPASGLQPLVSRPLVSSLWSPASGLQPLVWPASGPQPLVYSLWSPASGLRPPVPGLPSPAFGLRNRSIQADIHTMFVLARTRRRCRLGEL